MEKKAGGSVEVAEWELFLEKLTRANQIENLNEYLDGKATLTVEKTAEEKAEQEEARKAAEARRAEKAAAKKALLDSIGIERQLKTVAKLKEQERRDSIAQAARKAKARAKMKERYERKRRKGKGLVIDSAVMLRLDSAVRRDEHVLDSMLTRWVDSLDSVLYARSDADSTATPVPMFTLSAAIAERSRICTKSRSRKN
jgi:DNA polymerase III alpha subunit (gram-positive type)